MTAPDLPKNPGSIARQSRLRDALRENLKRRKSQLRGRVAPAAAAELSDPAGDGLPAAPTASPDHKDDNA
ncbi:MAG TPA: hypothetical protein VGC77_09595 [Rhodopseudomonas sp.]|uniref:hypothetical protein n=1 Tax=Rhodopseudomonas sp. TaxID=1078 RepID=UPI002ED9CE4A